MFIFLAKKKESKTKKVFWNVPRQKWIQIPGKGIFIFKRRNKLKFSSLNFRQTKSTNHVLVGVYIFIFSLSDCVYILVLEECLYHSLNLKCLMIIFANRGEKSFSQQSNVVSLSFSLQYVI